MKNWKKEKLGDVCEFVRGPFGGSLKKNIFKEDGFAVYEQQHAIYDQFNKIRYFIDEVKFNEMKRFEFQKRNFENMQLEEADLIVANYSLSFCYKQEFDEMWKTIKKNICKPHLCYR